MAVEKLTFEMNAVGNAVPEMRKVQRQLGEVQKQTKRTGVAMNQFGGALTGVSKDTRKFAMGAMQQAGYQIGDFAVQVANGTSKVQAFGQQGSQLLGIFGPVGAVLGGLVAIGSAVAIAFDRMGSASSAAKEAMDGIKEATEKARLELDMLMLNLDNIQQTKSMRAMQTALSEIASIESKISDLQVESQDANKVRQAQIDRQIASYERARARQQEIVDTAQAEIDENKKINAQLEARRKLTEGVKKQALSIVDAQYMVSQGILPPQALSDFETVEKSWKRVRTKVKEASAEVAAFGKTTLSAAEATYMLNRGILPPQARADLKTLDTSYETIRKRIDDAQTKSTESFKKTSRIVNTELTPAMQRAKDVGNMVGDSIETAMMGAVQGTMSVKDAFRSMAAEIISELYRIFVVKKITNFISGAIEGAMGGGIPAAPMPRPAIPSANGGGYTGNGARSGGLDGKGGFMAMLHPRETVLDHTKGQGSGGVVVNQTINISTGVQQTVRNEIKTLMPQIAESAKSAVVDAKRRGGSYGRAFA